MKGVLLYVAIIAIAISVPTLFAPSVQNTSATVSIANGIVTAKITFQIVNHKPIPYTIIVKNVKIDGAHANYSIYVNGARVWRIHLKPMGSVMVTIVANITGRVTVPGTAEVTLYYMPDNITDTFTVHYTVKGVVCR